VTEPAILVESVSKMYRLYHERNDSLKAAVLRGYRARYDEFWAVKDVSFSVPEGSTFALIGENGSGKSTLLKCLARILVPDRGKITTRGKISALLELGAGFHPELTGRENVYLNGSILGLSKKQIDKRFDDIVAFAGLEKFIDTAVKTYSSGMYVRLGFSIAINVDPDILLVDEVLAVGDAEFQQRCIEKVDELKSRGKTIVIVTHALGSVRSLCDKGARLEHGELRRVGPMSEIIDEYLGDVFTDRVQDGEHGQRWGTGEAQIEGFELLDASGQPTKRLRTGDAVTIRLNYVAHEPIEQAVFGIAIYRIDGAEVCGPNSRDGGAVPDRIEGKGHVDFHVERLPLLPGTYDLSASLCNFTLSHAYDHRHRSHRFDVEPGSQYSGIGVLALEGDWEVA
jgi:ABC-type polysaccharide/polyol phosphate transport system ATPase subunit